MATGCNLHMATITWDCLTLTAAVMMCVQAGSQCWPSGFMGVCKNRMVPQSWGWH